MSRLQKWIYRRGRPACSKLRAFVFAMTLPFSSFAMDGPLEYEVKAAFLLNFTKFVEWPASAFAAADSPIAICVWGNDPFGKMLDRIVAEEVIGGRKVVVRRIRQRPEPRSCQALFVNGAGKDVLSGVGPRVLTIGEGEGFVRSGGMIAFVVENRRVRFGINESAAEAAGLKLSSKLLTVARSVEK